MPILCERRGLLLGGTKRQASEQEKMRRSRKAFFLVLAASCVSAWRCDPFPGPAETKERISAAEMELLVEAPMATVEESGLAAGQAEFERLRRGTVARAGPGSIEEADLLTAFGLGLHERWTFTEDRRYLVAAHARLREAVPAYRKAFGSGDPEVALALHSFADLDLLLHDRRPTPEAHAALREALAIRQRTLGPRHPETRAAQKQVAALFEPRRPSSHRSRPSATGDSLAGYEAGCAPPEKSVAGGTSIAKPRPGGCAGGAEN